MIAWDVPPLWVPPAVIRPAEHALIRPGAFRPCTRAEGRAILADLVRSGRMTREEAKKTIVFIPWAGIGDSNLAWDAIVALGFDASCVLCLDPGDAASYGGSGQIWSDRSAAGNNVYRGATSSASSDDPTFNGSAGSPGAYWSTDGGDRFTLATANTAFFNSLHKDNALFSFIVWVSFGDITNYQAMLGTDAGTTNSGIDWFVRNSGGDASFFVRPSGGGGTATGLVAGANQWTCLGISEDEAGGALILWSNHANSTMSGAYSTPPTGDAYTTFSIMSRGSTSLPMSSGGRLGPVVGFNRAFSTADFDAFFNATRGRYGV